MDNSSSLYYNSKDYSANKENISCFLFRTYLQRFSNSMKTDSKDIHNHERLVKMMYEHCMKKKQT